MKVVLAADQPFPGAVFLSLPPLFPKPSPGFCYVLPYVPPVRPAEALGVEASMSLPPAFLATQPRVPGPLPPYLHISVIWKLPSSRSQPGPIP